jgi:hypothetical protein
MLAAGPDPAIRLATGNKAEHRIPAFLSHVYDTIEDICDNSFDDAGGLLSLRQSSPMGSMGPWIAKDNRLDASKYHAFIHTYAGDFLCFHPSGKGAWYHHEVGKLRAVSSLEAEVRRYFDGLVTGQRFACP